MNLVPENERTGCPYCNSKMYRVMKNEYPRFETFLCYACGGCVVFGHEEAPAARKMPAPGARLSA